MNDIEKFVREVYEHAFIINLGTADANGPWVASLVYVHDNDLNIYWISPPETRHSQALELNNACAGTIIASDETNDERALQISGRAAPLGASPVELARQLQKKRGLPEPTTAVEILEGKYLWYRLMPTRIELHYSREFGYERKRFR